MIVTWPRNMPKICWNGVEWCTLTMRTFKSLWSVVQYIGMPTTLVPPLPPPPAPPVYADSPSSNSSPNNACTDGSSVGIDS